MNLEEIWQEFLSLERTSPWCPESLRLLDEYLKLAIACPSEGTSGSHGISLSRIWIKELRNCSLQSRFQKGKDASQEIKNSLLKGRGWRLLMLLERDARTMPESCQWWSAEFVDLLISLAQASSNLMKYFRTSVIHDYLQIVMEFDDAHKEAEGSNQAVLGSLEAQFEDVIEYWKWKEKRVKTRRKKLDVRKATFCNAQSSMNASKLGENLGRFEEENSDSTAEDQKPTSSQMWHSSIKPLPKIPWIINTLNRSSGATKKPNF